MRLLIRIGAALFAVTSLALLSVSYGAKEARAQVRQDGWTDRGTRDERGGNGPRWITPQGVPIWDDDIRGGGCTCRDDSGGDGW